MPFKFNEDFGNEFPIEKQRMSNWCWAACTVSIRRFYDNNQNLSQQQLAANVLKKPICNSAKPLPPCNMPFDFGEALKNAGHLDGNAVQNPLTQNDLVNALKTKKPVGCQMDIPQIGGHAVIIISGKPDSSGALFLQVADPSDGSILSMSFSMLRNNFRGIGGKWVRSYFTKPLL